MIDSIPFEAWDLAAFDRMLGEYVVDGQVDYAAFQGDPAFVDVIEQIGHVDPATLQTQKQKLSFYINAYNALVIKAIVNGKSPSTFFGRLRFFLFSKYLIAGENLSLLSIERRRIIPLGDPRTHFAINCASASCPILNNASFDANTLDEQLERATKRFVKQSTRSDSANANTQASRILKWYGKEFDKAYGGIRNFLAKYADDNDTNVKDSENIEYDNYDWSLNGRPPKK